MSETQLTLQQSYDAMYAYIYGLWERTKNDELGLLLGEMSFVPGGQTADPAAWSGWLKCVDKAQAGEVDTMLRSTDGQIIDLHGFLKREP